MLKAKVRGVATAATRQTLRAPAASMMLHDAMAHGALLLLVSIGCSRKKTLTSDDLKSQLTRAISFASEEEMFVDYLRAGRATSNFAEQHAAYLDAEIPALVGPEARLAKCQPTPARCGATFHGTERCKRGTKPGMLLCRASHPHMSHSYSNNHVHVVYSTLNRQDLIPPSFEKRLYSFIAEIAREHKIPLIAAGGMPNHSHVLILLPPSMSLADAINKFKTNPHGSCASRASTSIGKPAMEPSP